MFHKWLLKRLIPICYYIDPGSGLPFFTLGPLILGFFIGLFGFFLVIFKRFFKFFKNNFLIVLIILTASAFFLDLFKEPDGSN